MERTSVQSPVTVPAIRSVIIPGWMPVAWNVAPPSSHAAARSSALPAGADVAAITSMC
jgi:hypothetical protein